MTNELKIVDEIKIMEHTYQIVEENNEFEIYIDGKHIDRFHMLALALNANNEASAWLILRNASILYHHRDDIVFNELYGVVAEKNRKKF